MAMDMWMGRGGWVRVRSESLHERTLLGVCLAFLGRGARARNSGLNENKMHEIHFLERFDSIQ
jgi:hypothetical protein